MWIETECLLLKEIRHLPFKGKSMDIGVLGKPEEIGYGFNTEVNITSETLGSARQCNMRVSELQQWVLDNNGRNW